MITINARLEEYVAGTPVVGADVEATVHVVPRWEITQPSGGVDSTSSVKPETKFIPGEGENLSQRIMSGSQGLAVFSFDTHDAVQRQEQVMREIAIPGSEQSETRPPDEVIATFSVRVTFAGLDSTVGVFPLPHNETAQVEQEVALDFVKVIVGHTTSNSATLWFCNHGTILSDVGYVCEIHEMPSDTVVVPETPPFAIQPVIFAPQPARHTAVLEFGNLKPATRYGFRLRWKNVTADAQAADIVQSASSSRAGADVDVTQIAGVTFTGVTIAAGSDDTEDGEIGADFAKTDILAEGTFTTAPATSGGRMSLAFGSCHTPTTPESLERWQVLAARRDYDLMLLMGDQIYETGLKGDSEQAWFDEYVKRYHQYWVYKPMREVFRRTPTYMTLDDHEIMDDWGSPSPAHLPAKTVVTTDPKVRARANAALDAYQLFQDSHNPGGRQRSSGGPFHYHFRWGPAAFFVMDSRSRRGIEKFPDDPRRSFPILGQEQFRAMQEWAISPEVQEADIVFFVAPVPLGVASIVELKKLYDELKGATKDVFGVGGAVLGSLALGPVGFGVGYVIGREFSEEIFEREINEQDLRQEPDLNDQWTSEENQPDLVRVLDLLFDLANNPRPRAVFVLSGDQHFGMMHVIASAKPEHRRNMAIFQLTSSPISRHPPLEKFLARYNDALPLDTAVDDFVTSLMNKLGNPTLGNPLSAAVRERLDKVGVRFVLDPLALGRPEADVGLYGAQLLGLRAERNFGRIGLERVGADRRVYRFHLGIHGKTRSLLHDMELDLDDPFVTRQGIAPNDVVRAVAEP